MKYTIALFIFALISTELFNAAAELQKPVSAHAHLKITIPPNAQLIDNRACITTAQPYLLFTSKRIVQFNNSAECDAYCIPKVVILMPEKWETQFGIEYQVCTAKSVSHTSVMAREYKKWYTPCSNYYKIILHNDSYYAPKSEEELAAFLKQKAQEKQALASKT